jgi:hypothetical protein
MLPDSTPCPLHHGERKTNSVELIAERNVKLYTKNELEAANFLGSDVVALVCQDCHQSGLLHQQSAYFQPTKRVGIGLNDYCKITYKDFVVLCYASPR